MGNHINHKKNNIIEIQPITPELDVISEIINAHKSELKNLKKLKEAKTKELNDELRNKKNQENILLNDAIKLFNLKNKIELEQSNKKYFSDLYEIKKKYEEEIKKIKAKYEHLNNDINNKYKLKNEKEQIKYNLKIQELNILYKNKFDAFKFESKIEKANSIITLNEKVFNIYKSFNYNYHNAVNINNILLSYTKNKMSNEKLQKVL
jgi:hypothetical protein